MGLPKWAPRLCRKRLVLDTKCTPGFPQSRSVLAAFMSNIEANRRQIPGDPELSDESAGPPASDTRCKDAPGCGSTGSLEQLLLQLQRPCGSGRLHHLRSIPFF